MFCLAVNSLLLRLWLHLIKLFPNLLRGTCSWEGEGKGMGLWTEEERGKAILWYAGVHNFVLHITLKRIQIQLTDLCKCMRSGKRQASICFRGWKHHFDLQWFPIYLFFHKEKLQRQDPKCHKRKPANVLLAYSLILEQLPCHIHLFLNFIYWHIKFWNRKRKWHM